MLQIKTNLKRLRIDLIGTQLELAQLIGVGRVEVSLWENNKRFPSKINLIKLETLFDKPHTYLFAEAGKEQ